MSTRRDHWQFLLEVGTSRQLAWLMLSKGQGPIGQTPDRCVRREFNESDKRGVRDYMNDLEVIVFVLLEELGLPELAVEKVLLFYGHRSGRSGR